MGLGVVPTAFTVNSLLSTGVAETISFSSGSGLITNNGADAAKVVLSTSTCSNAAEGGTSEVTDLGSGDAEGLTAATAVFTFNVAGTYKVCYKVSGGSYSQVSSTTIEVCMSKSVHTSKKHCFPDFCNGFLC